MHNFRLVDHINRAKTSVGESFLFLGLSVSFEGGLLFSLFEAKDIDLVHLHVACEALDVLQRR